MNQPFSKILVFAVLGVVVVVTVVAVWQTRADAADWQAYLARPRRVMGTAATLAVVLPPGRDDLARRALEAGEQRLRAFESRMSSYLAASALSKLNSASAGQSVALPTEVIRVLREARRMYEQTDGAFDVTAVPMFKAWHDAAKQGHLPDRQNIERARARSRWSQVQLFSDHVIKSSATVSFDLGGIAKGYAIDRAVEAMRRLAPRGGMVDVGGDVRVWGSSAENQAWTVGIRDPFSDQLMPMKLHVNDRAVCTSGNYARFVEINGRTYSHIIDPRSGQPADLTPSVTVVAADAMTADGWATALSVLGAEGLSRLPAGVEAMLITGLRADYQMHTTPGFKALLQPPAPADQPAE